MVRKLPREELERLLSAHRFELVEEGGAADDPASFFGLSREYRLLREVAAGGMGTVHLALDVRTGRRVAIKRPHASLDAEARSRFNFEGWVQSRLEHPGIIPVYEFAGAGTDQAFLVMQYVSAPAWAEDLAAGTRSARASTRLLVQVLAALSHAHARGVVHRDVKPQNILVREDDHVYLGDWGVAYVAEDSEIHGDAGSGGPTAPPTSTDWGVDRLTARAGTAWFRAPELEDGRGVTPRADVFACGRILQQIWGVRVGTEVGSLVYRLRLAAMPRAIRMIVRQATALRPGRRYASALAMRQDVQRFLDRGVVSADRFNPLAHLWCYVCRHRFVSAVTLLVLAGATIATLAARHATQSALARMGSAVRGLSHHWPADRGAAFLANLQVVCEAEGSLGRVAAIDVKEERSIALLRLGQRDEALRLREEVLAFRRAQLDDGWDPVVAHRFAISQIRWADPHKEASDLRWRAYIDAHQLLLRCADERPDDWGLQDDLVWSLLRLANPKNWPADAGAGTTSDQADARLARAAELADALWQEDRDDVRRVHTYCTVRGKLARLAENDQRGPLLANVLEQSRRIPWLQDPSLGHLETHRWLVGDAMRAAVQNGDEDAVSRLGRELVHITRILVTREGSSKRSRDFADAALAYAERIAATQAGLARDLGDEVLRAILRPDIALASDEVERYARRALDLAGPR
ncbi:MAG: serine/threonine-protein kinase [Planctomycetota bacterium]